ncbi:MAG: HAD-IC family P-type ATPase [Candidatus Berkelbacteria bacterium]|nr:MAG: HAD-IC family P-type ATPase [Candidatus Berkelbacteria bacterium]QQG51608.1 MAG: HAD-IC family P-type ATPase [Candidatus Berkelbacteria bacterium]
MGGVWSKNEREVSAELGAVAAKGLSEAEASRRLSRHGYNLLREKPKASALIVLLRQFQSPLTLILIVAALISYLQKDMTDTVVVLAVVVLNVSIGFFQEYRAERTIEKLRHALAVTARVIRDGIEQKIPAKNIVVGDIIVLEAGDRVPADARLIEGGQLRVNEAALTGETVPAHKRLGAVREDTVLAERSNMLFMSTFLVDGRAVAVVTGTGMNTEIGAISAEVTRVRPTPTFLQRKITQFGRYILLASFILTILIFFFGLSQRIPLADMFAVALSILVAIVPEGLPVALTVVLSVGLLRMYRRAALIRKLAGAETLGSATVICVDKTGTLTEGKMMVERILLGGDDVAVTGHGYSLSGRFTVESKPVAPEHLPGLKLILELVSMATTSTISREDLKTDQAQILTDPTETALSVVAAKAGYYAFKEERRYPEVLEIPFDQELRYSTSVHRFGRHNRYITKGSPEKVLQLSSHVISPGGTRNRLLARSRANLEERASAYAKQGYRLVALAYSDRPGSETPNERHLKDLTFVGYFCIADPIRAEVRKAISTAKEAGVRVIMLTGDHLLTAETIAQKIGLDIHGKAIHANDLGHHDLEDVSVVARATPADKLKIVEKLQRRGEIVAMTGDGVNDAPALKRADIGIAMGRSGTDVAIEASEMVLLQDNFEAIVNAIAEGRLIWENLRKVVFYLTSTTFAELFIIVYALFVGIPLPLLAVQILWMNLVTDGVMSMALTVEPAETDLMRQQPRPHGASLVDSGMFWRMVVLSLVMAAGSLGVYLFTLKHGVDYARTATLTAMVFFQLLNVFNARSHTKSVFSLKLPINPLLLISFAVATILQALVLAMPAMRDLLGLAAIDTLTVVSIVAITASIILADELRKAVRRVSLNWARLQQGFAD